MNSKEIIRVQTIKMLGHQKETKEGSLQLTLESLENNKERAEKYASEIVEIDIKLIELKR